MARGVCMPSLYELLHFCNLCESLTEHASQAAIGRAALPQLHAACLHARLLTADEMSLVQELVLSCSRGYSCRSGAAQGLLVSHMPCLSPFQAPFAPPDLCQNDGEAPVCCSVHLGLGLELFLHSCGPLPLCSRPGV